jgi:hypothetical protein
MLVCSKNKCELNPSAYTEIFALLTGAFADQTLDRIPEGSAYIAVPTRLHVPQRRHRRFFKRCLSRTQR